MGFKDLPDGNIQLANVSVPGFLVDSTAEFQRIDISIANGCIAGISASGDAAANTGHTVTDMAGAIAMPCFVDMHTHLDKGHILPRTANPDGTFAGALQSVFEDRNYWHADDVYARADFSLRCAYAHGTRAVRTHLDSAPPQDEISWPVFDRLRSAWRGRIDLQAVCLTGCDSTDLSGRFQQTVDLVVEYGGVLGLVTYPMEGLDKLLHDFFEMAAERGLDVDLHVDETTDPSVEGIRSVSQAVIDTGFSGSVTAGHLCSLSAQTETRAGDTLDLMAKAGLNVVSLPMCNLYLQDRHQHRTPRLRGVTLVHEMQQRGIPVSFASDNTRDPFYAYGDMDMLEVMRESVRLAHLDHSDPGWLKAFSETPAQSCGFSTGALQVGNPADLVLFNARRLTELLSRPQSDRIVLRNGVAIDTALPDYSELDSLFN